MQRSNGQATVLAAVVMLAILAITAASLEIGRLTLNATETQAVADASVLATAAARMRGATDADAINAGKTVATFNYGNGYPFPSSAITLEPGRWTASAPDGSKFDVNGSPHNAWRSTVNLGVQFIMAQMLTDAGGTTVTKQAIAGPVCSRQSTATLPFAVCGGLLAETAADDVCATQAKQSQPFPNAGACLSDLGSGAGFSSGALIASLPAVCNGSDGRHLASGDTMSASATATPVAFWQRLQCCVACKGQHAFTVPVVDCDGSTTCNGSTSTVVGFAPVNIASATDVHTGAGGVTSCSAIFSGCSATVINSGPVGVQVNQGCRYDPTSGAQSRCFGLTDVRLAQD